jgi:hypothetical protein
MEKEIIRIESKEVAPAVLTDDDWIEGRLQRYDENQRSPSFLFPYPYVSSGVFVLSFLSLYLTSVRQKSFYVVMAALVCIALKVKILIVFEGVLSIIGL